MPTLERRLKPRVKVDSPVYVSAARGSRQRGVTRDISGHGAFVHTSELCYTVGAAVRLVFVMHCARVAWLYARKGVVVRVGADGAAIAFEFSPHVTRAKRKVT